MRVIAGFSGCAPALVRLFATTFAASEGDAEGALIGGLVEDLLASTDEEDIRVFRVEQDDRIVAAAIFTRLRYPEDPRAAFLLSPMAVASDHQRRGVGQALLRHALAALRAEGVRFAMTYGDPAYYGRVGFGPLDPAQARPPLPLSQPHGWIGQSLGDDAPPALAGPSRCVAALNRGDIW